jgi:hypothetical protein
MRNSDRQRTFAPSPALASSFSQDGGAKAPRGFFVMDESGRRDRVQS